MRWIWITPSLPLSHLEHCFNLYEVFFRSVAIVQIPGWGLGILKLDVQVFENCVSDTYFVIRYFYVSQPVIVNQDDRIGVM
jgi:hypothetical protein